MSIRRLGSIAFASALLVVSCRQDETNGPCGGLVNWLCASPMECVTAGTATAKSICVRPCRTDTIDCPPPGCCPVGALCHPVDMISKRVAASDQAGTIASFCVPADLR